MVAIYKSRVHYLTYLICCRNDCFPLQILGCLLDLISYFSHFLWRYKQQGPVTPNTGANCPVLHFTAAVTEIPGTAVTTGQGSLSEGRGHIQCRACLRNANKRQWALHIHVFPPYRVYGNPARSCNSFDLRYSNPSAKRDNWVIMSKGDVTFSPVIFASKKWMKNLWCTPLVKIFLAWCEIIWTLNKISKHGDR